MAIINATPKIEFANSLRGVAVLMVLFGHYVYVFGGVQGQYSAFPSIGYNPFPWAHAVLNSFPLSYLNIGQVAVAFFFLVSGLVIPNAVASLNKARYGRSAFVIGRVMRIWPTYMLGLLISVSALWFASHINSAESDISIARILANMSLFRDWMGHVQIDGIVWTLEIEAKFYLFVLLFWSPIGRGKLYPFAVIGIAAIAAAPLGADFAITYEPSVTINNFLWTIPYLLYMSIGIVFNYHLRNVIGTKTLIPIVSAMIVAFVYVAKIQGLYEQVPASYTTTFLVFALMYFFAQKWSGGPIIRFFSKISYPLYASHAALGYTGMAYIISMGASPYIALAAMVAISTILAFAMHILIESPTHNFGKRIGRWITSSGKAPAGRATDKAIAADQ